MAKIPFTLEAWLKDKSQKVETRDGRIVHNIWRVKEPTYINNRKAEVCALIDGEEDALVFFDGGRYLPTKRDIDNPFDLFIVTPEPEMSEMEISLLSWLSDDTSGEIPMERMKQVVKARAAELLALAREQFIKDGYVIEKKAFHDAVEKVSPEVMKKVSDNVDMQIALRTEYEKGRADALKDLPRWKKYKKGTMIDPLAIVRFSNGHIGHARVADEDCYVLEVVDLLKLPGFKED